MISRPLQENLQPGLPAIQNTGVKREQKFDSRTESGTCTPALSSDDKLVAVGIEEDIHIFRLATQEPLEVLRGHIGMVWRVQFAPGLM